MPRPAEYCRGGSLYDCLSAAREQPALAAQLTWRRRLSIAIDAGAGLLYLHNRGIIHRDGGWGGLPQRCHEGCGSTQGGGGGTPHMSHVSQLPSLPSCPQSRAPTCWWTRPGAPRSQVCHGAADGGLIAPAACKRAALRRPAADFNLSKILEGAQPESVTSRGATNPIWLVSAGAAEVLAVVAQAGALGAAR